PELCTIGTMRKRSMVGQMSTCLLRTGNYGALFSMDSLSAAFEVPSLVLCAAFASSTFASERILSALHLFTSMPHLLDRLTDHLSKVPASVWLTDIFDQHAFLSCGRSSAELLHLPSGRLYTLANTCGRFLRPGRSLSTRYLSHH